MLVFEISQGMPGPCAWQRYAFCQLLCRFACLLFALPAMNASPVGAQLFGDITASQAASNLQFMLKEIGVEEYHLYRTHDLRRGHARDLQVSGTFLNMQC